MNIGSVQFSRDGDDVDHPLCLICGHGLSRQHIIGECRGLKMERSRLKEATQMESS